MKKLFLLFCGMICFLSLFSRPVHEGYDYSIVFTGWFKKDRISLRINNVPIFENYLLDNADPNLKGNLSLTQSSKGITIFYNNREKLISQLNVDFILDVTVTINKKVNHFKIDLRKGRVLLVNCPGSSAKEAICIEQIEEPLIL